jgi:hypothetical protein
MMRGWRDLREGENEEKKNQHADENEVDVVGKSADTFTASPV